MSSSRKSIPCFASIRNLLTRPVLSEAGVFGASHVEQRPSPGPLRIAREDPDGSGVEASFQGQAPSLASKWNWLAVSSYWRERCSDPPPISSRRVNVRSVTPSRRQTWRRVSIATGKTSRAGAGASMRRCMRSVLQKESCRGSQTRFRVLSNNISAYPQNDGKCRESSLFVVISEPGTNRRRTILEGAWQRHGTSLDAALPPRSTPPWPMPRRRRAPPRGAPTPPTGPTSPPGALHVAPARCPPTRAAARSVPANPDRHRGAPAVAAGPMLRIGARLGLSGCQQETCVPMQAYEADSRSHSDRRPIGKAPAGPAGVQPLQNARIGGYPAFWHRHWPFIGGILV